MLVDSVPVRLNTQSISRTSSVGDVTNDGVIILPARVWDAKEPSQQLRKGSHLLEKPIFCATVLTAFSSGE
jgi:hypothetical protein